MCITIDEILTCKQTHDARDSFKDVFQQLLDARVLADNNSSKPCEHSKLVADNLNQLAQANQDKLNALPRHDAYSRNIIGTDDNWIGFICRWEKDITSSIHGHPSFAYYQVLDGHLEMEIFEPINEVKAKQVSLSEMRSGDSIFSSTNEGQFDNLIHRVRTKDSSVFTIHLYSDNPAKGRVFEAE